MSSRSSSSSTNGDGGTAGNRVKKHLTFCSPTFACRIKCKRCRATTKKGTRCTRTACYGFPWCFSHWSSKAGVRVAPALHGKGLYATKKFRAGQWVCAYGGEKISVEELEKRYPGDTNAPYALMEGPLVEDAACQRGLGSMANTADERAGQVNNGLYYVRNGRFWLRTTRPVEKGDEILCDYGHAFDVSSYNKTTRRKRVRVCAPPPSP